MNQAHEVRVIIPPRTIVSIVLTLLGLWLLYDLREIVTLFLIVLALVVIFSPVIRSWERLIPRTLAIVVLYTVFLLAFILITALILPVFIRQLSDFLGYIQTILSANGINGDDVLQQFRSNINLALHGQGTQAITQIVSQFRGSLGTLYSTTMGFLGGIIAIFTVLVASFYLLLEEKNVLQFVKTLLPAKNHKQVKEIMDRLSEKMLSYLRGQLSLMVIVAIFTGLALWIIGVPYPLLFGLWSGLMELLPYVGPILGAVPAVIIAFTTLGAVKGIIVIVSYFLIQQIESQFLVPRIMGKALGLSPVVIIFAFLIGAKLLGFIGVVIAVPVAAAFSVLYEVWRQSDAKGQA